MASSPLPGSIAPGNHTLPHSVASDRVPGFWNQENFGVALEGGSLAAFTRPKEENGLGWTRSEVEVFLAGVRKDLRNTGIHAYFRM